MTHDPTTCTHLLVADAQRLCYGGHMGATRSALPPLTLRNHECPLCGETANSQGDRYVCLDCHGSWPIKLGEYGQVTDSGVPQCTSQFTPSSPTAIPIPGAQCYRCVRDAGHEECHIGTRSDIVNPDPADILGWSVGFGDRIDCKEW